MCNSCFDLASETKVHNSWAIRIKLKIFRIFSSFEFFPQWNILLVFCRSSSKVSMVWSYDMGITYVLWTSGSSKLVTQTSNGLFLSTFPAAASTSPLALHINLRQSQSQIWKESSQEKTLYQLTRPSRPIIRCDVWIVEWMRYRPTDQPTDRPTDQPTNQPTDTAYCRDKRCEDASKKTRLDKNWRPTEQ